MGRFAGIRGCAAFGLALIALQLVMLTAASPSPVAAATAPTPPASWQYRGYSMVSYAPNELLQSGDALRQLAATGANTVNFVVTWRMADVFSSDIYRSDGTVTDASLIFAIQEARRNGLQVWIKPHIDVANYAWRAYIEPTNRDAWFANYAAMINVYADIAQAHGATGLVIGSELIKMSSNPANDAYWRSVIGGARQRFPGGKLTYNANWGGDDFSEEWKHIKFWDALDYIGISAYFELADDNEANPSFAKLMTYWNDWITRRLAPFQAQWNKPVMFPEAGYRSADLAAAEPWNDTTRPLDLQEQVDTYESFFQAWDEIPWFVGVTFWSWNIGYQPSAGDTGYDVRGKPAYNTVLKWFGGTGQPNPSPSPSPTPVDCSAGRLFPETGKCVRQPFLNYWNTRGGLAIYGYPLSNEFTETLEDGKSYTVQYFERARFEYHPENAAPFDVLLGQFGRRIHGGVDPAVAPAAGARFYPETGHNVSGGFLAFWDANGGLAQFGYPITEVITETLEDGKQYQVQYFERARFEYHPENAAPYDILLGQFGRAILGNR